VEYLITVVKSMARELVRTYTVITTDLSRSGTFLIKSRTRGKWELPPILVKKTMGTANTKGRTKVAILTIQMLN